jgi:hypothetical protein
MELITQAHNIPRFKARNEKRILTQASLDSGGQCSNLGCRAMEEEEYLSYTFAPF